MRRRLDEAVRHAGRETAQTLAQAARPANLDIRRFCPPEAEVEAQIVFATGSCAAAAHGIHLTAPAGGDAHAGADRAAVRLHALELQGNPGILGLAGESDQGGRLVLAVDQRFDPPVVVVIPEGQAAGGVRFRNAGNRCFCRVLEAPAAARLR